MERWSVGRSVRRIWLADTERWSVGRSVRRIWLADTESWSVGRSVRRIWLADTESWSVWRSVQRIWLADTEIWSVWRSVRLVCPARVIWLDDPFSCLMETCSDWTIRWSVLLRLPLTSCFPNSYSHLRTTRNDTQNASCFMTNTPFNLLLHAKQTKRLSPLLLLTLPVAEF